MRWSLFQGGGEPEVVGYVERPCCATCAKVFTKSDYDESPSYFCTKGAQRRPRCMSVGMDEMPRPIGGRDYRNGRERWDRWAKGREPAWPTSTRPVRQESE